MCHSIRPSAALPQVLLCVTMQIDLHAVLCKCLQLWLSLPPGQLAAAERDCEQTLIQEHPPHVVDGCVDVHGSGPPATGDAT